MNKILYVGHIEFPYGQAQVQRQLTMSKALTRANYDVTVLCRFGIYCSTNSKTKYLSNGSFEGIKYQFCSGTPFRDEQFFVRNINKLKGALKEFLHIVRLGKKKQLSAVFVTTNYFHNILFYWLACKIGRVQIILDYVEYFSNSKEKQGRLERIGAFFYDHCIFSFIDKIICISDFLISKSKASMPERKILKIPAITEFEKFKLDRQEICLESYLLYCGSVSYFEVIDFVISAFERSKGSEYLYIIAKSNDLLTRRINGSPKRENIRIFSDIPFDQVITLYKQCKAFVIPLRPNINDVARFPHKISEVCAAGKAFISNTYGEVEIYFEDELNALLCDGYDIDKFANKMDRVYGNIDNLELIGKNALRLGEVHFSHLAYVEKLKEFIES